MNTFGITTERFIRIAAAMCPAWHSSWFVKPLQTV